MLDGMKLRMPFAVPDFTSLLTDIEAGIGFGLTQASDNVTLKLILSFDLN